MVSSSDMGVLSAHSHGSGLRSVLGSLSCIHCYGLHRCSLDIDDFSIANTTVDKTVFCSCLDYGFVNRFPSSVWYFRRCGLVDRPVLFRKRL